MEPIDHLKRVLESVDGLRGKVYLYSYDAPQEFQPPAAVLNYATLDSAVATGGRVRIAMSIRVNLYFGIGNREGVSRLMLDAIRACLADGRVTDVTGGTTDGGGPEAKTQGALRNMVLGEFLATVRA